MPTEKTKKNKRKKKGTGTKENVKKKGKKYEQWQEREELQTGLYMHDVFLPG